MKIKTSVNRIVFLWILLLLTPSSPTVAQTPATGTSFTAPRRLGFGHLYDLAWSPDGKTLALAAEGGVYLLPYQEGAHTLDRLHGRLLPTDQLAARSIAFSPDGKVLAIALENGTVRLQDFQTGTLTATLNGSSPLIDKVGFSPDGQSIAFADADAVHVFDARSGNLKRTLPGHSTFAFSPDNGLIASPSEGETPAVYDHAIRVWDVKTGQEVYVLSGDGSTMHSVTFNADGTQILAGGENGAVLRWFPATGNSIVTSYKFEFTSPQYQSLNATTVREITFDPKEPHLATAIMDADYASVGLSIWNVDTGEKILNTVFDTSVESVAVQPHENIIAVGGMSNFVLWDVSEQKALLDIQDAGPRVVCCGDQQIYVSVDPRYVLWEQRIFDSLTGIEVGRWVSGHGIPLRATVNMQGNLIAVHELGNVDEAGGLEIFEIKPSAIDVQITKLVSIETGLRSFAFQADDTLVYLDVDNTIKELVPHSDRILKVYKLPDGFQDNLLQTTPSIVVPKPVGTLSIEQLAKPADYTISGSGAVQISKLPMLAQFRWYGVIYRGALTLYSPTGNTTVLRKDEFGIWTGQVFDLANGVLTIGPYSPGDLLSDKANPILIANFSQTSGSPVDRLYVNSAYTLAVTADIDGAWVWDWVRQ